MKKLGFFSIFIFTVIQLIGQKPIVKLEIEPKSVQVGDEIVVTVKTNIQGEIDIDFPSAFVNGYAVMNGMEQEMDYNTGRVISLYYYSQNGVLKKEGSYTFGPAYVKSGSKIYKSNTVEVVVQKEAFINSSGEISAKQLKQNAFGVIEVSKKKVYEGEPLILNAKVYSKFYPTHIEDYQSYNAKGILDKHELSANNRLVANQERVKNIELYGITYDRSLVFPNGAGKMQIDPFKLILKRGFEGMPVVSTGIVVEVLPLPKNQPKSFIGMVGKLSMNCELNKKEIKKGDVFSIKMTLQGTGNLHNIDFPKINLPKGLTLYGDPKQTEKYTFTTNGVEGKVDLEYTIQVNKEGSFNIPPIEVSYFDVKAKKYVTIKSDEIILDGDEVKLSSTNSKGKTTVIAEKQTNLSESKNKESDSLFNSPFVWVSLSSLLLIAGFVGISARTKKSSTIAFDKSISEEITLKLNWNDVENQLKDAEIALQQNDSNKLIANLENAILTGIRIATNESSLSKNSSELLNLLKTNMQDDGLSNQLKAILE
ncbi:MAG: BatD family protein, partial [Bacteroidota bacterium]